MKVDGTARFYCMEIAPVFIYIYMYKRPRRINKVRINIEGRCDLRLDRADSL